MRKFADFLRFLVPILNLPYEIMEGWLRIDDTEQKTALRLKKEGAAVAVCKPQRGILAIDKLVLS
ncbi:MAG: hypothetical protein IJO80_00155 [Firmicutes bacterium]|nr:hypothetical protein [Bacillota bacterium]MBQ6841612.1 hypothetical protein [Bacillota bacterium]